MSTRKPEPYAPDLFSEHARLAQLGARVLEVLGDTGSSIHPSQRTLLREQGYLRITAHARSLGLLGEEEPEEPDHAIPGCGHVECLGIDCDQEPAGNAHPDDWSRP